MNFIKEHWTLSYIKNFQKELLTFSKGKEKSDWEQKIVNTKLKCIAVSSFDVKKISKEISCGNFLEFLDFMPWENHTNTLINGTLICFIKDFKILKTYLEKYANLCDNWASCDVLKFNVSKNKSEFFELSKNFISSNKPFVRRIGILILFKFIKDENYIKKIFEILNSLNSEKEYYVNMICAWLVCECFIKEREKTLKFLETNNLNKFTINKAISKCRDSFRVSSKDKTMLLKFKR